MTAPALLVTVLPAGPLGAGRPVTVAANQVVIALPTGEVVGVARVEGPDGVARLVRPGDREFERAVRQAGHTPPAVAAGPGVSRSR